MISAIACVSRNGVIGKNNRMLWSIREDMQLFKEHTIGKAVVMGSKTYRSIGQPLENRRNLVLSKTTTHISGCEVFNNIEDIISLGYRETVVIGGETVYEQFMPYVQRMYLSILSKSYKGNVHFPDSKASWRVDYSVVKRCVERINNEELWLKFFILTKR
jgi:dihydrofolate reductase